ncbi:hypothetical protein RJ640_014957 [Escallonia rubra]|uniref:Endonuclease/exonuclease/phosphatase domain-containing protein n=1 Tax=Escallonia rubra TaxID=112253 RepID=A0AA88SNX2_9ASTE|nr:hypothetical protein RJ640_014957 [Escallonia rubra]
MWGTFSRKVRRLCSRIRWLIWRRPKPKVVIRRFGKLNSNGQHKRKLNKNSASHRNSQVDAAVLQRPIRVATFNAALFSLAPAIPKTDKSVIFIEEEGDYPTIDGQKKSVSSPKSILKQSPLRPSINGPEDYAEETKETKSKLRVSINLPVNEISLAHNKVLSFVEESSSNIIYGNNRGQAPARSPLCIPSSMTKWMNDGIWRGSRTILDVLKEVDADILALQDVKAGEEKDMKPLSDLAYALGMNYVFAESWAPEYGNAILSKWPIKRWKVHKIFDDEDFRNLLKATIDVPWTGEVNFYCTQLDHLSESWRMKQINKIIQLSDHPHILAGGLNSLNGTDYSSERWTDIVKYYEDMGKPTPKVEVTNLLNERKYTDSKGFAAECEPVVIIAKGQTVQGTCKYGTRVDYILASPDLPYKFVPGSYSVISSKGTSDHHIVKVDITKVIGSGRRHAKGRKKLRQKISRIRNSCSSGGNMEDKHLRIPLS